MNDSIKYDLYRYKGDTSFKSFIRAWLFIPGFRYTYHFRKSKKYKRNSILGIIHRIALRRYYFKYGIQIPINTKIGKGLYIGHFGNIVVNNSAVIGENCNIAHGVTIGQINRGKKKGTPKIGNRVWIGTGSVVVGNIKVGNNVLIAPLTYVNDDIPDNSLAIGNPFRVIPQANATENYITKTLLRE